MSSMVLSYQYDIISLAYHEHLGTLTVTISFTTVCISEANNPKKKQTCSGSNF